MDNNEKVLDALADALIKKAGEDESVAEMLNQLLEKQAEDSLEKVAADIVDEFVQDMQVYKLAEELVDAYLEKQAAISVPNTGAELKAIASKAGSKVKSGAAAAADYLKRGFKGEGVTSNFKAMGEAKRAGNAAKKTEKIMDYYSERGDVPEGLKGHLDELIAKSKDKAATKAATKRFLSTLGRSATAYGTAGAGVAGAAYGTKKLTEKK